MLQIFDLCFVGLVEQQSVASLDPSGRTDLLTIIDRAQKDGSISWRFGEDIDEKSHKLSLHRFHVEVCKISGEVELRVPLHLIASVCYILEQQQHVICVSIAPDDSLPQKRDIALLLANSKAAADLVCESLAQRFQAVYREAATMNLGNPKGRLRGSALSSSASRQLSARLPALATATSLYTSSDASSDGYIAQLSAGFSDNELHELIALLQRYQQGQLPFLEYLHKMKELHGPHRQHLLARHLQTVRSEDLPALNDFLRIHSQSDWSASISSSVPIWSISLGTEDSDAPDSPWNMSSSARPSSGTGGGIRSFLSKLRKPSDQVIGTVQIGSRTYDAGELQKLVPQLEESIAKKDQQLKQAQLQYDSCQKRISELETEVKTMQRECDKLRSVLEQKATSAASPGAPASPGGPRTDQLGNDLAQKAVVGNEATNQRSKKLAVSAEPTNFEQTKSASLQHHSKTAGSKQLIRDAVQKNDFLKQLAKEQIIELVECMYEMRARAGQWVIQEGEPGDRLFVVAEGELQVSREGQSLGTMRAGTVMGELAILYNCTRTASVQAVTDVQLWVLDRSVFQMITQRLGMERHQQLMTFLSKVSIFENLTEDRISKIADVLDQDYYAGGHHIIRQGEKGDAFFIINSGQVKVTQLIEGETEPREIRVLGQGDFFGERALLGEEVRTANIIAQAPGVEVLTLDRDSFLKLIGDLEALKRDYGDKERLAAVVHEPPSPQRFQEDIRAEFESVKLPNIKRLATLGVGGFGRVELVCLNGDKSRTFALKALKKKHIVDTRQQEHIFAERNIMMETSSDWIVKLFKTFRDTKYVYMLLEVCLGGELWTTLRDRGHFDDYTARFFVACVLEGLEYLHRKNIVYRDLKPENCLLTNTGYLKLVDFGFAKKLASGRKTWTFCGTPEYVSPEIILNKGHDQAADYWALGIFICELMLGRPPFQASDPMKTYTLILKGVDALEIPNRRIGKTATALVKKLCRDNPGERLGSGSGGVNDIRKHRWFMGFDWEGLRSRTLKAPILPKVANPADVTNFDNYPPDMDVPPDEFSGWDEGF